MAISLETLALAKKLIAKSESQMSGDIEKLTSDLAGKGDTLDYDGVTLSLKSGEKTLSSVAVEGGEGGGYTMAEDAEVEEMFDSILGTE